MGSCLKRKEALKPPTHRQALLALLPAFQLTLREGKKERSSQKHRDKEKGKGDSDLTGSAIQSVGLEL